MLLIHDEEQKMLLGSLCVAFGSYFERRVDFSVSKTAMHAQ